MTFNLNKISKNIAAWAAVLAIVLPMNISAVKALAATTGVVGAENFNTVNDSTYKGISVGFNAVNFGTVSSVEVDLKRADGSDVIKYGAQGVFDIISNKATVQHLTAPFVINSGTYVPANDKDLNGNLYWQVSSPAVWTNNTTPVSVTITVTDENGSSFVQNNSFNQGAPSWPSYADITPPTTQIVSPTAGAIVNGLVSVKGAATDTDSIASSTFNITGPNSYSFTNSNSQSTNSFGWNTTGLTTGQYTLSFTATDQAGNTSSPVTETVTVDNTAPATPTNFMAKPGDQQVNLSWDSVSDADHYRVSFDDTTKNPTTPDYAYITTSGNGTSLNISQLANGHNYTFGVQAIDSLGNASAFATTNATPNAISAPTNFVATPGDGKVNLSWTAVPTAAHYKVSFDDATQNPTTPVYAYIDMADLSTNLEISGLANGHLYNFGIQATDAFGEASAWTVATATPNTLAVINAANNSTTVAGASTSSNFTDKSNTGNTNPTQTEGNETNKSDKNNQTSDKNGKIKGEATKNDTASDKAVLTFIILLLALAAGIGGYYAYEWWLTKQDEKLVEPIQEKKVVAPKKPVSNRNKSNSNKKRNGRW